jgi:hypothetical protein
MVRSTTASFSGHSRPVFFHAFAQRVNALVRYARRVLAQLFGSGLPAKFREGPAVFGFAAIKNILAHDWLAPLLKTTKHSEGLLQNATLLATRNAPPEFCHDFGTIFAPGHVTVGK